MSLRPNQSALLKTPIAKEVLALEDAIRQVATETASKPRTQTSTLPPSEAAASALPPANRVNLPQPDLPGSDWSDALLPARQRLLIGRTSRKRQQGASLRDVVEEADDVGAATAKAPQTSRPPRDAFGPTTPENPPVDAKGRSSRKRQETSFRDVVDEADDLAAVSPKAPQISRPSRDSFEQVAEQYRAVEEAADPKVEGYLDPEGSDSLDYDARQEPDLEPAYEPEDEPLLPAPPVRHTPAARHSPAARRAPSRTAPPKEERKQKRPSLSYGGLARLLFVLLILAGLVAAISWQWSSITEIYQFLHRIGENPQSRVTAQPELPPRAPQGQASGQPSGTTAQGSQTAVPAASLIEADTSDPQGKRYAGSVVWRTETISGGLGLAPELAIRGDIEIPERRMTVTWSMRRNTDKSLPASHTIEIMFNLPADFAAGGIANVPAIVMKQSEEARGSRLAARIAKVTNGFFLVGLSAADTDVQRDKQLLKDRPWFDIGIVYANGNQAILAVEKGESGNRVFAQAFAAWDKK